MKTFKQNEHSIFARPFGIRGKMFLGVGVMVFFDLTDGNTLYTEQDMWKAVPDQLGEQPMIDQGMPKARGEVLAAGACFAPKGETRPASKVRIRVGEVDKTLSVYGDRYWKKGLITEAEPFTEMPLDWTNAYGGEGFKMNRKGKGIDAVPMPDGSTAVPLPNLELPAQQIGSPGDSPTPAGFGQLDIENPVRAKKNGTYDDKWKNERWPYFPDDLDYEFFNAASEDQFLKEFFDGGESLTVENMNPDMPLIESSLPNLRMRTFVTVNPEFKLHTFPTGPLPSQQIRETDEFREVASRLETVWLFPSILRGVCIYRGVTEIEDEEYMDVPRLLVRHEDPSEPPKTLEHYRDLQIQLLDRGVDIDMAPFEAATAKAKDAMLTAKNIAKTVDNVKQKALGNAPKMPAPTPQEMLAMSKKQMAAHSKTLDKLETMAKGMHAEHGHQVKVPLDVFDKVRGKMAKAGEKIEKATTKLSAAQEKAEAKRVAAIKQAGEKLKAIDPKNLKKAGIDINDVMPGEGFPLERPVNPWHDTGFPLVVEARKGVDDSAQARKAIKELGLKRRTVKKSWMGWNAESREGIPTVWGLDEGDPFTIPEGLALPRFDGSVLNRLLVFPEPGDAASAVLVPGSDDTPLFLPSTTLIDLPTMPAAVGAPVVRVADELQALYVEQEAGDCVSVICLATPDETPGDDAAEVLKEAKPFLVVLPLGWDKDARLKEEWNAWKGAFPDAEPLELEHGTTVFEARKKGSDIRDWIFEKLPKSYTASHSVDIGLPEPGKPPEKGFMKGFKPPLPDDIPGLVTGVIAEVKGAMEAKFAPLKEKQAALLKQVNSQLANLDLKGTKVNIPTVTLEPKGGPKKTPTEIVDKAVSALKGKQAELKKAGRLTPEMDQKFDASIAKFKKLGVKSQALSDDLNAQFAAKTKELDAGLKQVENMEPPDKAKETFAKFGIDPDKIKPLTREQAKRLHDQGQSLAGYILSGVDLSELDLTGADFTGCRLEKTIFKDAVLDEATFIQALGQEADFTGASLKGANMERSIFAKAIFEKSDLSGARLKQAAFKEASFVKANLSGADLDMAALEKIDGTGANFTGANMFMSLVGGDVTGADFRNARVKKCLFNDAVVDKADFRDATLSQSLFNGVTGENVTFAGADLTNFRTGNNTVMRGADFTGANLSDGALRESDLSESKFTGAILDRAVVEDTQLVKADFNRSVARGTRFTKANLEGASMRGMNMHTGSLRKARLVDADLRGSNFYAADFYKAVLGDTRFEGSNLKKSQLHNRLDLLGEEE
ncbi:MAG: DUF2169 domain-containing protein [Pseudodesulfovibrio sp.]